MLPQPLVKVYNVLLPAQRDQMERTQGEVYNSVDRKIVSKY